MWLARSSEIGRIFAELMTRTEVLSREGVKSTAISPGFLPQVQKLPVNLPRWGYRGSREANGAPRIVHPRSRMAEELPPS
jgi:hypothetical protein